jgi:hypothetical protein
MRQPARAPNPTASSGGNRRRHVRVPFTGRVRLMLETPSGLAALSGYIIDISVSGCALRLYAPVQAHVAGRVQLSIRGADVWFPIVTRWARSDSRGWTIGAEFDRPTPEKQELLRRFIRQRLD